MDNDWKYFLEIFIASGAGALMGALVILTIDYLIKYHLYRKRNFQEAISIQLALHQMLVVSLQIRQAYNAQRESWINIYRNEMNFHEPEIVWNRFRHIDLPAYLNPFDIVKSEWDFTQFLTGKRGKVRDVLKNIIPAKLGYQSLMNVINERNKLLIKIHPLIEDFLRSDPGANNIIYQNNKIINIIGVANDEKLKSLTDVYVRDMNDVIKYCYNSFLKLSEYINDHFCSYTPMDLDVKEDMRQILQAIIHS